jgi:hypothetical protein
MIEGLKALLEQEQDDRQQPNIRAAIEMYERGMLSDPTNPLIKIQDAEWWRGYCQASPSWERYVSIIASVGTRY